MKTNMTNPNAPALSTISTEAWVLYSGQGERNPAQLVRETYTFDDITDEEVLTEPIFGCWEGNMGHAIKRDPIDICMARGEAKIVLGNAGVVKIVRIGRAVNTVRVGDICIVFCNGIWDDDGYPQKILGYDAPQSIGVLAKTIKLHHKQVIPLPKNNPFTLPQWAAFSLRYITAYANWHTAYRCWRVQMSDCAPEDIVVCAWGGGVALAEISLAKLMGCRVMMVASNPARLALLQRLGIDSIDRGALNKSKFEVEFLEVIQQKTRGKGVSIFIDNIGTPVYKLTARALARQGVITTSGWKNGTIIPMSRALECIERHIYVHTHYARYQDGVDAINFAVENDWMATVDDYHYSWDEIPRLAEEYEEGRIATYFPIFSINDNEG